MNCFVCLLLLFFAVLLFFKAEVRLRVVPILSTRERRHAFLAGGDFHVRSTIPQEKWGATRSLGRSWLFLIILRHLIQIYQNNSTLVPGASLLAAYEKLAGGLERKTEKYFEGIMMHITRRFETYPSLGKSYLLCFRT